MLRLCDQIRCDKGWLAVVTKNETLGRACQKIDGAIKRHNFLGRGHKQIARPDNFVYARNAFRPVRQGRNRLGAADAIELTDSQQRRRRQRCLARDEARPLESPSLPRLALESLSSAKLRAGDSVRRERNIRLN